MDRIRRHFTSAHVIAMVALMVALGGTGYAALKLPKNSVGSKQIKTGGVGSSEVKNRSLKAGDFKKGQLPKGAQGPQGVQGQQGIAGQDGAAGATGPTGNFSSVTVQFEQATADLADGAETTIQVFCPAGQQGIGGGARGDDQNSEEVNIGSSRPAVSASSTNPPVDNGTFTGWRGSFTNRTGNAGLVIRPEIWVVCVPAPAP